MGAMAHTWTYRDQEKDGTNKSPSKNKLKKLELTIGMSILLLSIPPPKNNVMHHPLCDLSVNLQCLSLKKKYTG